MSKMERSLSESEGELCPLCQEQTEIFAIGPCDHPICYRCSTRMRVLCDQRECPICRGNVTQVVFVRTKQNHDKVDKRDCIPDRKYRIFLEDESVWDAYQVLTECRCRVCDDGNLFNSFQALSNHMKRVHKLFSCDLCVLNLKIFPYECRFYSRTDLATHRRLGDADNRSYRGHPLCQFCDERYMDKDELLRHLRRDHYYCHFCDRDGSNHEYFHEYADLRKHFHEKHFLCEEGECASENTHFIHAFNSEIDLKAHIHAEHKGNKTKVQAKEIKTLGVSFPVAPRRKGRNADVTTPGDHEEVNENRRGQRSRRFQREDERNPRNEDPDQLQNPPVQERPNFTSDNDFPTLGYCPPPFVTMVQKEEESVEDFPSLVSQSQSDSLSGASSLLKSSATSGKQRHLNNVSTIASVVSSSGASNFSTAQSKPAGTSQPAPTSTRPIPKTLWQGPKAESIEDFPALSSDKKSSSSKGGQNLVNLGAWTKKQNKNSAKSKQSNNGDNQLPSSTSASSLARIAYALRDDGEFPTLGGNSANSKQLTWVQQNQIPSKQSNMFSSAPLGNSNSTVLPKSKNKNKQKQKAVAVESGGKSLSLSSIANEIHPVTKTQNTFSEHGNHTDTAFSNVASASMSLATQKSSAGQSRHEEWETVSSRKSSKFENDDQDLSSFENMPNKFAALDTEVSDSILAVKKSATMKNKSFHAEDDFPALSAVMKTKTRPLSSWKTSEEKKKENGYMEKAKQIQGGDFPELLTNQRIGPPLQKPAVSGLGACASFIRNMPSGAPGLSACAAFIENMPSGSNSSASPTVSLPEDRNENGIPSSEKRKTHEYIKPLDMSERNLALIDRVRRHLIVRYGGFDQFRDLSQNLISGTISAKDYHKRCQALFGKERFSDVLPELVALLPDIQKQHELAEAHKQDILGTMVPLGLKSCTTCFQLVTPVEFDVHLSSHCIQ